jgi:hypothetical protein
MKGLDGCSLALAGGVVNVALASIAHIPKVGLARIWWILLIPPLAMVIYGILWLWLTGRGHRRREFAIRDGQIVRRRDGIRLAPQWMEQGSEYHQTDAFLGYSFYALTLYGDGGELLARNGYLNEAEYEDDIERVLAANQPECRAIDLYLLCEETPTRWLQVRLDGDWARILCGPLLRLSEQSRLWWRRWLRPELPIEGRATIGLVEFRERVAELTETYGDEIRRLSNGEKRLDLLNAFTRRATEQVQVMTPVAYKKRAYDISPNGGTFCHDGDEPLQVEFQPR